MTEIVEAKINGEFQIKLPKHRADRPEWYTDAGWEKKRLKSMHENIGKGDVVFYVGSEEGEMPALCQMWGAEVVMFEPNDKVWPNTKFIWDANKLKSPLGCFVGFASNYTTPHAPFHLHQFPDCANGEVIPDHAFKELYQPGAINQVRIDDIVGLIADNKVPTAISLDVEGSEWEVLKGAEDTLRTLHPKIWLSLHPEFMFRMFGAYQYDLRNWIRDMGYKETLLDYQHEMHLFYE